jgi:protein-S-isoprenylcysteine O-methyltransferase Ste14
MLTTIVILLYVCVMLFDFLPSRKDRSKKESIVYFGILSVSFCVLLLYSFDIKVPGPSEPIRNVVETLFKPSS